MMVGQASGSAPAPYPLFILGRGVLVWAHGGLVVGVVSALLCRLSRTCRVSLVVWPGRMVTLVLPSGKKARVCFHHQGDPLERGRRAATGD